MASNARNPYVLFNVYTLYSGICYAKLIRILFARCSDISFVRVRQTFKWIYNIASGLFTRAAFKRITFIYVRGVKLKQSLIMIVTLF